MGAQVPEGVLDELRPVDFDERFVALAKDQIFGRKVRTGQPLSMWPAVAQFWGAGRLRDKVKLFGKGLFLPRESMARLYPVPAGSWKMNFYYAVRLRDLLRTYGGDAWRWLRRDKAMRAVAQEGRDLTALKDWLTSSCYGPVSDGGNRLHPDCSGGATRLDAFQEKWHRSGQGDQGCDLGRRRCF
jgi:hypothetical protein